MESLLAILGTISLGDVAISISGLFQQPTFAEKFADFLGQFGTILNLLGNFLIR